MLRRLAILLTLLLVPALARAGDGSLDWRTLRAPGVQVHFPSQLRALAQKVAATYQDAVTSLAPHFPYRPRLLHLTLDDYSDSANGFATVLPYDHVHLQAYPPEVSSDLADHGDWVRALVFHELTHVMHMGEVSGIPGLSHYLVGRRWLPNQALPRFFLEGLATYSETRFTGHDVAVAGHGGRVDSAQFMALLRAAVLDGTLPTLDELTGHPVRWPRGNGWYLYGSLLIDDLAQTYGHEKIETFLRKYGARIVPYGINNLAREVWGKSLQRLWEDAKVRLTQRVHAEWAELGIDPTASDDAERLTWDGEWRGRIRPGTQPGTVVVAHAPKDGLVRIEELDVEKKLRRVLHVCELDCDEPMVSPDGKWLLFTESRHVRRLYTFRELIAVSLPAVDATEWRPSREPIGNLPVNGKGLRLTVGARMRSPSVFVVQDMDRDSALGQHAVYVAVREGRTEIRQFDVDAAIAAAQAGQVPPNAQLLVPAPPLGEILDSPVVQEGWSIGTGLLMCGPGNLLHFTHGIGPRRIAISMRFDSQLAPKHAELLYEDEGWVGDLQDRAFSSVILVQRSGFRLACRRSNWCARTPTGVASFTQVVLERRSVVAVEQRGRGLDVFIRKMRQVPEATYVPAAPLQQESQAEQSAPSKPIGPAIFQEFQARPMMPDGHLPSPAAATGLAYTPTPTATEESTYKPWQSAYPRAWYPLALATGDNPDLLRGGAWLGAAIYGSDPLDHWSWSLSGQVRTDASDPIVLASLVMTRWEPIWQLDAAYQQGFAYLRNGFRYRATPTDRLGFRAGGNWILPGLRDAWTVSSAVRLVRSDLRNPRFRFDFPYDPGGPEPIEPWTGWEQLADLGLGYGYGESYPESVTNERLHAISLGGTVGRRADGAVVLGNTGKRVLVDLTTTHHWPLGNRRVFGVDAHLDVQPVSPDFQPAYTIQGLLPLSAAMVLGPLSSGITVRGASGAGGSLLGGNGIAWGTASLYLPLADVGHGLDVLPLYARRLVLVPFADAAYAFDPPRATNLRGGGIASLGAELRLDYDLDYSPHGLIRLGFAHAFGEFGGTAGYLTLGL
jgi:hypothetical protein